MGQWQKAWQRHLCICKNANESNRIRRYFIEKYILFETNFDIFTLQLKGDWHENKLIKGEWIYPNGNKYVGNFEFNRPNGDGIFIISCF
jgi:hypothetical protein